MKKQTKTSMVRRNKLINNLPKYDLGIAPISSGYQRATNSVPVGYVSLNGADLSSIVSGLRKANTSQYLSDAVGIGTFGKAMYDINKGMFARKASEEAAKNGAETAAKTGLSNLGAAGLSALATIPEAIRLGNSVVDKNSFSGLSGGELAASASKNTQYAGDIAYTYRGGVDSTNLMKKAKLTDTGENIDFTLNAISTGAGVGGTIGSLAGPAGSGLGILIGGLVGLGGGLLGWGNDEEETQLRKIKNYNLANAGYNMQNLSSAESQNLRNTFALTHGADKGFTPTGFKNGKVNALIGGGEVVTEHDKNGKVKSANVAPITPSTPERADVIPAILDQGSTPNGVIGNKINPITGNRFAVDARPLAAALNDPNIKDKEPYKQALTELVALQDSVPDEDMKVNKKLPKFDSGYAGMSLLSTLPGIAEAITGLKQSHSYAKEAPTALYSYAPNTRADAALSDLYDLQVNPYTTLRDLALNKRKVMYDMNTASLSPALRLAMLRGYYNDVMTNKADTIDKTSLLNKQYRGAAAQAALSVGQQEAQQKQQANALYNDQLSKSAAARRKGIETGWQTVLKGLNTVGGNWFNNYWADRNINLWYDGRNFEQQRGVESNRVNKLLDSQSKFRTTLPKAPMNKIKNPVTATDQDDILLYLWNDYNNNIVANQYIPRFNINWRDAK